MRKPRPTPGPPDGFGGNGFLVSTSVVISVVDAATSAAMRPSGVLPCATATSARLLPVPSSVRSASSVMPMYVAAVARKPGPPRWPLFWTASVMSPGSDAMTAVATLVGPRAAAAIPPERRSATPEPMSALSRSEVHMSVLQSRSGIVTRLQLEENKMGERMKHLDNELIEIGRAHC